MKNKLIKRAEKKNFFNEFEGVHNQDDEEKKNAKDDISCIKEYRSEELEKPNQFVIEEEEENDSDESEGLGIDKRDPINASLNDPDSQAVYIKPHSRNDSSRINN